MTEDTIARHDRLLSTATATGMIGAGRAHAKVILLGEHTVVRGTPAIAFPMPMLSVDAAARHTMTESSSSLPVGGRWFSASNALGAMPADSGPGIAVREALRRWKLGGVKVDVSLDCAIPPARGLGSSAACAAAAVRAVADLYGKNIDGVTLYEVVQCGEQVAHGRASGVDASAAVAASPIWFQTGVSRPLRVGVEADLIIADSGTAGTTQEAVAMVGERLDADPAHRGRVLARAAAITGAAAEDLGAGRAKALGHKLLDFQDVLHALGVSTTQLDTLITKAMEAGALGAKLTGGGLGGCVLALTDNPDATRSVDAALRRAGARQTWIVPIGRGGIR